tara:strand:- start:12471 stop:12674 length:204 start_codon:yes stop_codon:yes gene_type:complete
MIKVEGHPHLYRDEKSGAIINSNNLEYNQRLKTLSSIKNDKNELKQMREDIDELKILLRKLLDNSAG